MSNDSQTIYYDLSISHLRAGMHLPDDVYDSSQRLLLLKKDYVLTDDLLRRLQEMNGGKDTIRVSAETVSMVMESRSISRSMAQQLHEESFGYAQLSRDSRTIFDATRKTAVLSEKSATKIGKTIATKTVTSDPEDIFRCINAPRELDEALLRHSINVSFLNGLMAGWLELSANARQTLTLAGLLHDIGKTRIPTEILDAPRQLTQEEFAIVRKHPEYSYALLEGLYEREVLDAVLGHHERMSGGGYPHGLYGPQISLFAKITAVSDVYDAMISRRSYKQAHQPLHVLEQLMQHNLQDLDEEVSGVFCINMTRHLIGRQVLMSDGAFGVIRFIPPNDLMAPVVESGGRIRQAGADWQCVQVAADNAAQEAFAAKL